MPEGIQEMGVGVLMVYVVLRWALDFLKWKNGSKPLLHPNPHPDKTRTGELAATYWLREFALLHEGLRRIENLLRERLPKE